MSQQQIITIVGGGTAGWMSACLLAKKLEASRFLIQVVESPDIQTVGVGEGSTPFLKDFFDTLQIKEHDWMPACQATYKCGIRFPGWTGNKRNSSYFHPFYNELDTEGALTFFADCQKDGNTHPDGYFLTSQLSLKHQSPIHLKTPACNAEYGYHFDAGLLGHYLRDVAIQLGVSHIEDTVVDVYGDTGKTITALQGKDSGRIIGDLFIDCTGFQGLLIRRHLQRGFLNLTHRLMNDSAIAVVTEHEPGQSHLPSFTDSIAMQHGWMWRIPLQSRMGNGYVFSSAHTTQEEAEQEMRGALGLDDSVGFKRLKWQPGRLQEHWFSNCVAIGLSQGFLEPLEAPMLNIMQHSIDMLVATLQNPRVTEKHKHEFNLAVNSLIDGTMDYIQAHYVTNCRSDTQYWQDVRLNTRQSAPLKAILQDWQNNRNIDSALRKYAHTQPYFKTSWLCLLAGMSAQQGCCDVRLGTSTRDYFYHDEALTLLHEHGQGLAQIQEVKYG
ncbi:MAG: tryptophan halogenase family protein [Aestuariibacter sp.]